MRERPFNFRERPVSWNSVHWTPTRVHVLIVMFFWPCLDCISKFVVRSHTHKIVLAIPLAQAPRTFVTTAHSRRGFMSASSGSTKNGRNNVAQACVSVNMFWICEEMPLWVAACAMSYLRTGHRVNWWLYDGPHGAQKNAWERKQFYKKMKIFVRLSSFPDLLCWCHFPKWIFAEGRSTRSPWCLEKVQGSIWGQRIIWWWRAFPRMSKTMNFKHPTIWRDRKFETLGLFRRRISFRSVL